MRTLRSGGDQLGPDGSCDPFGGTRGPVTVEGQQISDGLNNLVIDGTLGEESLLSVVHCPCYWMLDGDVNW